MSTLLHDLRFAARQLLKAPGVTAIAVLSLAFGIGANTVVFTWLKAAVLNPLPNVSRQGEIVTLLARTKSGSPMALSYLDYIAYRDGNRTLSGLLVQSGTEAMSVASGDRAERVYGMLVSGNYFDVLGVRPVLGRGFLPDEDRSPDDRPVVVLSYALWQRRFGGDPRIVGRAITLNARPYTVVGIAPRGFLGTGFGLVSELYVPMMMQNQIVSGGDRLQGRGYHWLAAIGRLKPGTAVDRARADMNVVAAQLARSYPDTNAGVAADLKTLRERPSGAGEVLGPVLLVMAAVVALVLLIACANVANLLLSRAVDRRREVAIRLSLGATRARLFRQFLTESVLLALVGGVAGLFVASWSSGWLMSFVPPMEEPVGLATDLDPMVLAFAVVVSLATGIFFGIVPAFQASRERVAGALQDERASQASSRRKALLRNGLVLAQVTLSVVLLVGAGLFLRALVAAQAIQPGFQTRKIVLAGLDLFPNGYNRSRGLAFYEDLLNRVRALPRVESAALARRVPLDFSGSYRMGIDVDGYQPGERENMNIEYTVASPGYFRTIGIPILGGREFTWQDSGKQLNAVIVNQTMAKRFWKGQDPLGKRIRLGKDSLAVVGVARDVKYYSLSDPTPSLMYLPLGQYYRADEVLHVRTSGDPASLVPALRAAIRGMDRNVPVFNVKTMEEHLRLGLFAQRVAGLMLAIFGGLALLLASVGLYGVISYGVRQRWHELGIRMALGATPVAVRGLVVRQGLVLTSIGVVLGLAAAAGATRMVVSLLFGVNPIDPLTFAAVAALMIVVAALASFVPARRASRLDPVETLRHE